MQPKTYTKEKHGIQLDAIDNHAFYVIQKLRQAGYEAYLVGGSIRDLLLQTTPKDFDISTSAKPEEIKKLFRGCILIGKRFRLAHIRFGKKVIEVSTFRSGDIENSTFIVRDNDWGSAEEDVLRRDFTINGLFYDPQKELLLDYVGGYLDSQKRILRTIGNPEIRFRQDPVRMIRLIKFRARFALNIDPAAEEALHKCKEDIIKSSQARILEELLRMLESGSSEPFFRYLSDYGLLYLLMPSLARYLTDKPEETFSLLKQVDKNPKGIQRPILMSCLVFPLFSERLHAQSQKEKNIHLGIITEEANHSIDAIFRPFFSIPRKMKGIMASLLASQFRFTPLSDKFKKRLRIPRDPSFPLSLEFFKLRAEISSHLFETYHLWHETHKKSPHHHRRR